MASQTPEERIIPEPIRLRMQREYGDVVKTSPHQMRINRSHVGAKWKDVLEGVLEEMGDA